MKKKVLSLLLCTAMAVSSLVGCGGTDAAPQTEPSKDAEVTTDATADATTEKIVLDIYAQYADDDTKVPYDYAVEQLATAYPNVELNLIV